MMAAFSTCPSRNGKRVLVWLSSLILGIASVSTRAQDGATTAEASSTERHPEEIEEGIQKGLAFLLETQNSNGSWGSPALTKGLNIYAPVPGAHHAFRTAVTAMCVSALIECGDLEKGSPALAALEKGEAYLLEELPKVRRATADAIYNVWTHGYGLQALVRMHGRAGEAGLAGRQKAIEGIIRGQIDRLERYESVDGGWGYYDFRVGSQKPASSAISFTTATMLVAFHEAEEIPGIDVPDKLVQRALDSIQRQRKPDNSYMYGEYLKMRPMYSINRPGGSLGRSQACNLALRLWGDDSITDAVMEEWLVRLRDRNGWLSIGRKRPIPHESWFAVAGYFFYYGHYYAALCVETLPEAAAAPYRQDLAHIILALQEKDGSWWDFPFYNYHQPYGTAFALMTLVRCREGGLNGPSSL